MSRSSTRENHVKKQKRKNWNPILDPTSIDVARRYIQENRVSLPDGLVTPLLGALRARDVRTIRRLAELFDTPQLYECPSKYYAVAQCFALLSKVPYPFGGGDAERRSNALEKFSFSEKLCRIYTRKLDHYWANPDRENHTMRVLLSRGRLLVDKVLGSIDDALNQVLSSARYGPGMTFCSTDSARTTPYYKIESGSWSVTPGCRPYADLAMCMDQNMVRLHGDVDWHAKTVRFPWRNVASCRLTFVPKDERTFRTIAIEPYGNVLVQLGVHEYLTSRLLHVAGIDIRSQERNQKLAAQASENWLSLDTSSTIDLSSASDCVSPGLVRRLVRPQWAGFLDDIRSRTYELDGVEYPLSKWSSMGNGYTFSLETLLFWAMAQACEDYLGTGKKAAVYGDDIIVSRQSSLLVLELLRYTGFRVNNSKTNVVGPFRESCGKDYHTGVAVRPVFLKSFKLQVTNAFNLINAFSQVSLSETSELIAYLHAAIPEELRCYGTPSDNMDSHIHVSLEWLRAHKPPGYRFDKWHQTHYHRSLVFKPKVYGGREDVRYVAWLYNYRQLSVPGVEDRCIGLRGSRVALTFADFVAEIYGDRRLLVTQRSRGLYRVRSTRCHPGGTAARCFFT